MNWPRFLKFEARTIGFGIIGLILLGYILFLPPPSQITNRHLGMVMLGVIIACILLGFPIAFTLIGLGILFGFVAFHRPGVSLFDSPVFDNMVLRTYGVMTLDVIIAVPLFIFMGYIVERSGIIDRLFHTLELAMSRVPAALAVATILTCAMFAAATGIIGATVTLMGLLVLPPMLKAGYDTKLAAGSIAAGGTLGILIPPSVLLILYGATAGVSVVNQVSTARAPSSRSFGRHLRVRSRGLRDADRTYAVRGKDRARGALGPRDRGTNTDCRTSSRAAGRARSVGNEVSREKAGGPVAVG